MYKKKKKNLFQNDLNECIFVYVHENEAIQKCEQGRLLCWKRREFSVFGGLLCLFFFWFLSFLFVLSLFFTFLLSLLHHNETFSTNIHREPIVGIKKLL